jgi:hypothetical protein
VSRVVCAGNGAERWVKDCGVPFPQKVFQDRRLVRQRPSQPTFTIRLIANAHSLKLEAEVRRSHISVLLVGAKMSGTKLGTTGCSILIFSSISALGCAVWYSIPGQLENLRRRLEIVLETLPGELRSLLLPQTDYHSLRR